MALLTSSTVRRVSAIVLALVATSIIVSTAGGDAGLQRRGGRGGGGGFGGFFRSGPSSTAWIYDGRFIFCRLATQGKTNQRI